MADLAMTLQDRAARLGRDRDSGAAELLTAAVAMFGEALAAGVPVVPLARTICAAQPTLAPMWNASLEAIASTHSPGRFERFAQRVSRSAGALRQFARQCFMAEGVAGDPLRVVTISYSSSAAGIIEALADQRRVDVSCAESRPGMEGRRLATRLAEAGVRVAYFADAAIGHALDRADAVIVGADAISAEWFVNKSGTRMLAAAAALQGVPLYVAATRDKFLADAIAARVVLSEAPAAEIWATPAPGVSVRNPYFERTPLEQVATLITDFGVLGAGMVPEVCRSLTDPLLVEALKELDAGGPPCPSDV